MTSSFVPSARISMTVPTPLLSDASARRSVTTRGCGEVCYQVGEGGVGRGTRERERERRRGMRRRPLFRRRLQPQPRGLHSCVTQCTPRAHLALSHSLAFPRIFPDPPARGARVAERRRLHESTLPRFNQPQDGHFDTWQNAESSWLRTLQCRRLRAVTCVKRPLIRKSADWGVRSTSIRSQQGGIGDTLFSVRRTLASINWIEVTSTEAVHLRAHLIWVSTFFCLWCTMYRLTYKQFFSYI